MKKLIVALFMFAMMSVAAKASPRTCIEKLTQGYTEDSVHYSLNLNDVDFRDYGRDHLAQAIFLTRHIIDVQGCKPKDINFARGIEGRSHSKCGFVNHMPTSLSCYIETNLGYWFVSYDLLENANFIFSRWD